MFNFKRLIAAGACAAMTLTALPVSSVNISRTNAADATVADSGLDIDYARALQYSIYFYDANMCGDTVEGNNLISWRGDCHTYDAHVPMIEWDGLTEKTSKGGTNLSASFMEKYKDILDPDGDGTIDVAGGFHDAGDHVEFGIPENYSAATLGWGYYEFRDSYAKLGQDAHMETILRHFNDYLMKCTFRDKDGTVIAHCYQVGDGTIDHKIWQSPEVDSMPRPAFFLTADKPQTDYVVSACASLAINYLNFKDTDPDYAAKSLDYAQALWDFANANEKELSDNGDGPGEFYNSSKWEDDWCWAAAWMYLATGDKSVFDYAYGIFDYYAPSGYCYNWNDMWGGAAIMWAVINQEHPELNLVQNIRDAQGKNEYVFDNFWDDDCIGKCLRTWQGLETEQGFAFLSEWGSCRYATAMALICLLHDKYNNGGKPGEWSEWAKKQIDYVLGDNDITFKETADKTVLAGKNGTHGPRSFVVGYNSTSVKNPHHRAASGLTMAEDPREQKHVLWGALAGGPDGNDAHSDSTNDWRENEVTIDYNAAFVGACAAMYEFYGTPDMAITENFPPEETVDPDSEGSGYWVEAIGVDKPNLNGDGSGTTQISFKVLTGVPKPLDKITVRYFFDVSECTNGIAGVTKAAELYDQSSSEDGEVGGDGVLTGPFKYDKKDNTYYVDITWDGYIIANSGKKYQFEVGMYYGDFWDPTNDWSYDGLKIGTSNDFYAVENPPEELAPHICLYDGDGVLIGGIEPDGTTPEADKPAETTTAPVTTTTSAGKTMLGDANEDTKVNMADAVAVLQNLANSTKYPLTAQGEINADCDGDSGLTGTDAIVILRVEAGELKQTDLPTK
ncbi:MAG: glycoside hydrolase family 9 protein [Ruminococcus sp.]|nr:glycoside hydrolase family 9 protein [Ruminococcus sp.]